MNPNSLTSRWVRSCGHCTEYRRDIFGRKACLNPKSPVYQTYRKPDDVCDEFAYSGQDADEIRRELRAREAKAKGAMK